MTFEAAWSPRGAAYLRRPRFGGATLQEIVAECPDRLAGRTHMDAPDLDERAIVARWPDALIFTESFPRSDRP